MKVSLTTDEVNAVRVAIRMASATHTELVSMSQSKEVRAMLTDSIIALASVDRKMAVV